MSKSSEGVPHGLWNWKFFWKWVKYRWFVHFVIAPITILAIAFTSCHFLEGNLAAIVAGVIALCFGLIYLVWYIKAQNMLIVCTCILSLELANLPMRAEVVTTPPKDASAEASSAAGIGCAIVIIVAGVAITIILVKFCQKHFPKSPSTNSPPSFHSLLPYVSASGSGSSGAASTYDSCGSCNMIARQPQQWLSSSSGRPPIIEITLSAIDADNDGSPEFRIHEARPITGESNVVDGWGFHEHLAGFGLKWTGTQGEISYSRDGRAATADEVPIRIDSQGAVTLLMGDTYPVFIERSRDLQHWETIGSTDIPMGGEAKIYDATGEAQQFYRLRSP